MRAEGDIRMREWHAVIFDMDGLMLDTETLARRAWTRAMADLGLEIPNETYVKLIGRTVDDVRKIIAEEMGADVPFDEISRRKSEYMDQEIAANGIPLKPGLLELLDWLDAQRIPKAVASSTHRQTLARKLELVGLYDRFPVQVCGDEIEHGKPAPGIFLVAAEKLGARPEHCVVLEDSEPGIVAAHRAGMIPILVPDQVSPSPVATAQAFRVLDSLVQVRRFLEETRRAGESPESRLTQTTS